MLEELLVYSLLLRCGLTTLANYNKYLDNIFMQKPDDILLELEICSCDLDKTISLISEYGFGKEIDSKAFGKFLFSQIERAYILMPIEDFAKKTYCVWSNLPSNLEHEEPFFTLCYAGDPLSYGDEEHTRELYDKIFSFYKKDTK